MSDFVDTEAKREAISLNIGIVGPSGAGKTWSALELATGIQKVTGGDIYFGDTDNRRSLQYAENFRFRHVPFEAPFSSARYLKLLQYFEQKKARVVIVDSISPEHDGAGGYLEAADAGGSNKIAAFKKPSDERRKFISGMLQLAGMHIIFCAKAKDRLKMIPGEEPVHLGYMPICGKEFIWDMTVKFLLLPGAVGVPVFTSDFPGERAMIKMPEQFKPIFEGKEPVRLSADVGQKMAEWAAGGPVKAKEPPKTRRPMQVASGDERVQVD